MRKPTKCQDCDGQGWTVVARMRCRTVPGWDGEPEQRWEPEPEQEQCQTCNGTGEIVPPLDPTAQLFADSKAEEMAEARALPVGRVNPHD